MRTHRKNTPFFQVSCLYIAYDIAGPASESNTSSTSATEGVPSENPEQLLDNYSQLFVYKSLYLALGNILCCISMEANNVVITHWLAQAQLSGDTGVTSLSGGRCRHISRP
jgi:hypothetical protein